MFGLVWLIGLVGFVWFDFVWLGLVGWFGLVNWFGWFRLVCFCLVRFCWLVWFCWFGLVWLVVWLIGRSVCLSVDCVVIFSLAVGKCK